MDLDVIFHGQGSHSCDRLTVPHARYAERPFVLAPLADLTGAATAATTSDATTEGLLEARRIWDGTDGEVTAMESGDIARVIPMKTDCGVGGERRW